MPEVKYKELKCEECGLYYANVEGEDYENIEKTGICKDCEKHHR